MTALADQFAAILHEKDASRHEAIQTAIDMIRAFGVPALVKPYYLGGSECVIIELPGVTMEEIDEN